MVLFPIIYIMRLLYFYGYGFAVATRDTSPFETAGVQVINPWTAR